MNTTNDFLDAVKAKQGFASDYALCKFLGESTARIGNYRSKRSFLDDLLAVRVANILDIDPLYVIASVNMERSKKEAEKSAWRDILERLGGVAATVVIGFALTALPAPSAYAAPVSGAHCILCKVTKRHRKNRWLPFFPAFPR